MPKLTVNGQAVETPAGARLLDAAAAAGASVPTLCHHPELKPYTSCMLCVVRDGHSGRLLPACSAPAQEGATVETDSAEIRAARKDTLDLLLSEHVGDCEAPCRRACPHRLNVPTILRRVGDGEWEEASAAAAPGSTAVCRGCSAPCEKACRRQLVDQPVAIRSILLLVAAPQRDASSAGARPVDAVLPRFDSRMGRLREGDLAEFMKEADPGPRVTPARETAGLRPDEAVREARRCLHCDCRKRISCRLRVYAEEYGAEQGRFRGERPRFERVMQHAEVVYEPGKCIKCGLCVRLAERAGEQLGLTFVGRGFTVRIGVPLNESLAHGLQKAAAECVAACPTGALAWRKEEA